MAHRSGGWRGAQPGGSGDAPDAGFNIVEVPDRHVSRAAHSKRSVELAALVHSRADAVGSAAGLRQAADHYGICLLRHGTTYPFPAGAVTEWFGVVSPEPAVFTHGAPAVPDGQPHRPPRTG
ncbi:hypothetical protein Aglo03_27520 [Actinokineospora globicatena]|uniref:Uncharacterized protein n=1 Tax=Actinokineospora globicatena TaxID=103729 RepID=A0A9W6QIY8_9PSEU|nr:hypothetical protein Aglo03_27520 [Actinokineospora globicatena]